MLTPSVGLDPYFVFDNAWSELRDRVAADGAIGAADKAFMDTATPVGFVGDVVVITAPDDFVKTVMERRLRPVLVAHLSAIYERHIEVAFFTVTTPAETTPAAEPGDSSSRRLRAIEARLARIEKKLGIADRPDPATMTQLDRAEHVERVRTHLREWTGYDPSPEEEQEADEAIEAALGRRGDSGQDMPRTAQSSGTTVEQEWTTRFGRSADHERSVGITAEWLAEHKAGTEEQRSAG